MVDKESPPEPSSAAPEPTPEPGAQEHSAPQAVRSLAASLGSLGSQLTTVVGRLVDRFGGAIIAVLALAILLLGLGSSGLWEPWEMDRADLARNLTTAPEVAVALGPGEGAQGLRVALEDVGRASDLRLRSAPPSTGNKGSASAGQRDVRYALDRARTRAVAGVILDADLLVKADAKAPAWAAAGRKVNEALKYLPNGDVVIALTTPREGGPAAFRDALDRARLRALYSDVAGNYRLPAADEDALTAVIDGTVGGLADGSRLTVVDASAGGPDGAAAVVSPIDGSSVVHFKDRGDSLTVAPLTTWIRAASYTLLGRSEFSTRLPGVLLALLTLLVVYSTASATFGRRAAFFTGLVLATTPLFFAQARNAAGDPALMCALALFMSGLLLRTQDKATDSEPARGWLAQRSGWLIWAGLVVGFLGAGLFAPILFVCCWATLLIATGSAEWRAWRGLAVFGAVCGALALWVGSQSGDGFAGQFRLTHPLFSDGPTAYMKNFDLMVRQVGFGLFPWSPLVVVAIGFSFFYAAREKNRRVLTIALWFAVPSFLLMLVLKDFNRLLWPAAPAAALAVGLMLTQLSRSTVTSRFLAAATLFMMVVLVRESMKSPEPLVGFLAFDPPFAASGALQFPESLKLSGIIGGLALLAAFVGTIAFGGVMSVGQRLSAFFARQLPRNIALGVTMVLLALIWVIWIGGAHGSAASASKVKLLGEGQREFLSAFGSLSEPTVLIAILSGVAVILTAIFHYALKLRSISAAFRPVVALGPAALFSASAGIWGALALVLALSVNYPDGFWGETLTALPSLVGLLAAALVAFAIMRWSASRASGIAAAVAIIALLIATRLIRDAGFTDAWVTGWVALGWIAFTFALMPILLKSPSRFALGAGAFVALTLVAIVVPLLDRYQLVEQVLYPTREPFLVKRVLVGSVRVWFFYILIIGLLLNPFVRTKLGPLLALAKNAERGPAVVTAFSAAAVLIAIGTVLGLHPGLSLHVSQAHVLDAWQDSPGATMDEVYRHGSFGAKTGRDTNFYTADIGEIRDRQSALRVLLGAQDHVARVERPEGTEDAFFPGWSNGNDRDGDGARDHLVISGFATATEGSKVTDSRQSWTPGALRSKVAVDINGRSYRIADNDATSFTVEGGPKNPFGMTSPSRRFYAIDDASAADHRASAPARTRRALLLPTAQLSDINHAFRKLSGGRHLPIADGRSYRVLLATSWLADGEEQQNRIDNHTYTQAEFDALKDPRLERRWGSFDDTIQVVGFKTDKDVGNSGGTIEVTVFYKALKRITKSYKIFMHMDRPGGGGRIHGDHWPLNPTKHSEKNKNCGGCFRTDHWLPGDIVAETFEVDVAQGTKSGDYEVWVGFFTPGSDKRLPVKGFQKGQVKHDGQNRLAVGRFQIR